MQRHERLNAILEVLAERGRLSVDDVAGQFNVSQATVRRDFDDLAAQRLVSRTRGGVVREAVSYDLPLRYKAVRQADEKHRIAEAASALVQPGTVVGLNGGTTTSEVAHALAARPDLSADSGRGPGLTVVTNALNIASALVVRPQVKVVVIGGVARTQSYELIGPLASRVLDEISLDVLFLGVNAISADGGASAHHEGEAEINRLMAGRARRVVVVADASKVGQHAFARICAASAVHSLLTDRAADREAVAALEEAGVRVQLV